MTSKAAEIVACPKCGKKNRMPAAAKGKPRCGNCQTFLPWIADADADSFGAVVEDSAIPVLLDLWAPWCGPCRMVSPALEKLARENPGQLKLVKVNVDTSPSVARRFDAMSIPTLIVLRNGEIVSRQIGAAPEQALRTWLRQALAGSAPT